MRAFLVFCLALLAHALSAATLCVSVDGSGDGSGSDWNNTLVRTYTAVRGNTYYYADGSGYTSKAFTTAVSGTTTVTLKKATEADHGPATGWTSDMGDGQAVFTSYIRLDTAYFVLDGNRDGAMGAGSYGFRINFNGTTSTRNSGLDWTGSNTTVNNVDLDGGAANTKRGVYFNGCDSVTMTDVRITNYGDDAMKWTGNDGITLAEIVIDDRNTSDSTHADIVECQSTVTNVTWSNSKVRLQGQGVFFGGTGAASYTNIALHGIVFYGEGSPFSSMVAVTDQDLATGSNIDLIHCTFFNLYKAHDLSAARFTGSSAINNIYWQLSSGVSSLLATHDYNLYQSSLGSKSEANEQLTATNPFVDSTSLDFRLAAATDAGDATAATAAGADLLGTTRSTPDRGAYEYDAGATVPDAPTGLAAAATGQTIALTWTNPATDETGTQVWRAMASGGEFTLIATTAADATSYNDAGLLPGTAYFYKVRNVNAAGTSAYTSEATDTTAQASSVRFLGPSKLRGAAPRTGATP